MILHLEGYAKPFFCPISAFSRLRNPRIRLFKEKATEELETISGYLAQKQRYIGNLRNQRSELGDLLTAQLNLMVELATPNEDDDKPKRQFIKQSNIHTSYNKKELETGEDVDEYLSNLREAMMMHIQKNHNILLD